MTESIDFTKKESVSTRAANLTDEQIKQLRSANSLASMVDIICPDSDYKSAKFNWNKAIKHNVRKWLDNYNDKKIEKTKEDIIVRILATNSGGFEEQKDGHCSKVTQEHVNDLHTVKQKIIERLTVCTADTDTTQQQAPDTRSHHLFPTLIPETQEERGAHTDATQQQAPDTRSHHLFPTLIPETQEDRGANAAMIFISDARASKNRRALLREKEQEERHANASKTFTDRVIANRGGKSLLQEQQDGKELGSKERLSEPDEVSSKPKSGPSAQPQQAAASSGKQEGSELQNS